MKLNELKEIKTVGKVEDLTKRLGQTTNKYRALKTPASLKGVQRAEDQIEKELGQK
jgi:hypothetical protein